MNFGRYLLFSFSAGVLLLAIGAVGCSNGQLTPGEPDSSAGVDSGPQSSEKNNASHGPEAGDALDPDAGSSPDNDGFNAPENGEGSDAEDETDTKSEDAGDEGGAGRGSSRGDPNSSPGTFPQKEAKKAEETIEDGPGGGSGGGGEPSNNGGDNKFGGGTSGSSSSPPGHPWGDYPQEVDDEWLKNPPQCVGTDQDWLAKYFEYRLRFRGNDTGKYPGFIDIGTGPGKSLPAAKRVPGADCSNNWYVNEQECSIPDASDAHGYYNWGDSTVWLGYYFATLATEYKMFKQLGIDTSQTVEDLYYALEAFNRVDRAGEMYFSAPGQEDGFFTRADIPAGFHKKSNGEYRFKRNDQYNGYACVRGSESCGDPTIESGNYISQDQVVALTYGLALIKKLVPESVSFSGVGLRREAQQIQHRMVTHLSDHSWKATAANGESPPTRWGADATPMSNQLAKAANWIVGDRFGVDDYRDFKSRTQGATIFTGLDASWSQQTRVNRLMALEVVAVTNTWNPGKFSRRSTDFGAFVFPYTRAILHDDEVGDRISDWKVESTLTKAPCSGPCHRTEGCAEGDGWRNTNRWKAPPERYGYRYAPVGEFNGLDYMLMHNLYFLYKNGDYRYAEQPQPSKGTDCSGFKSLSDIVASGPDGNTKYRASHACAKADKNEIFCGRPFSSWLKEAYNGNVDIRTGEYKWNCSGNSACTLSEAGTKGSGKIDLFIGTNSEDQFKGKGGNDCIYGLGGADTLKGNQDYDEIHGGAGNDEIYGENSSVVISGESDVLYGDAGEDHIEGRRGDDEILGGEGDDELIGGANDDLIEGELGDDYLKGDSGADLMRGGLGNDEMKGDAGGDWMWGGTGHDKIKGDSSGDSIRAGPGNDFLKGDSGGDSLQAHNGKDRVCGNWGSDSLWGGWSLPDKDACRGGQGDDKLDDSCDKEASRSECTTSAFNDWEPSD